MTVNAYSKLSNNVKKKALFIIITKTFFELLKTIQKQKKNFFLIYY